MSWATACFANGPRDFATTTNPQEATVRQNTPSVAELQRVCSWQRGVLERVHKITKELEKRVHAPGLALLQRDISPSHHLTLTVTLSRIRVRISSL
mmetsp:Transcript_42457/g.99897  ORF Transcript_42457/g.99897 Transcript_42457/m.99897 type:complete len:96 (+) Transcript_42457:349-636(+)